MAEGDAHDGFKAQEIVEVVREIRERVRSRHPTGSAGSVSLPDLLPILHARDAAMAKAAAIGGVNPRPPGLINAAIQAVKKTVARLLDWHVRDQVEFNRSMVSAVEAVLESLNENNRALTRLAALERIAAEADGTVKVELKTLVAGEAAKIGERFADLERMTLRLQAEAREHKGETQTLRGEVQGLRGESQTLGNAARGLGEEIGRARDEIKRVDDRMRDLTSAAQELKDVRAHWAQWRQEWEKKLSVNEVQFLRSVADLEAGFQHRASLMEANFRDLTRTQHSDFTLALERAGVEIQKRLWEDLEKIRIEYERLIHAELRLVRQRAALAPREAAPPAASAPEPALDPLWFAERFRGSADYVREKQRVYVPLFQGCGQVLDLGCGRGEFLELMREAAIPARGVDLSAESVALCRSKGLDVEKADLFAVLHTLPDLALDGVFSAQVVEHLPPERVPELIRLASSRLARGGVLVLETPNPECLAALAMHFYLDPTHSRPVPSALLRFYMEEFGFGGIEVRPVSAAVDSMPSLASLPSDFRDAFFGGLDYAILGRKL